MMRRQWTLRHKNVAKQVDEASSNGRQNASSYNFLIAKQCQNLRAIALRRAGRARSPTSLPLLGTLCEVLRATVSYCAS